MDRSLRRQVRALLHAFLAAPCCSRRYFCRFRSNRSAFPGSWEIRETNQSEATASNANNAARAKTAKIMTAQP